jgi:hypothetical protein
MPSSSGFGRRFLRNVDNDLPLRDQKRAIFIITALRTSNFRSIVFAMHIQNLII